MFNLDLEINYEIDAETAKDAFHLFLSGEITPKARPRLLKNHAYLPEKYRNWKKDTIATLREQWTRPSLKKTEVVVITGARGQRGDLDNIIGAILDAMVQARVIKDDSVKNVPSFFVEYAPNPNDLTVIRLFNMVEE